MIISVHLIRFYPSKAKEIADKIIEEELHGAVYDDTEAKAWSVIISDKVREKVTGRVTNASYTHRFVT